MSTQDLRNAVKAAYEEILGRNSYSQSLRDYCYKTYRDGKYYSDCSSSVSYAYQKALGKENSFGVLNTAGMYNSKKFVEVPVTISKGQIQNPEVLEIGDMLLYAGTDNSRPGCVGHVEMYAGVITGKHYLYGHGSGTPRRTEMTEKNKSRYNSKTSTKVGNKGLIKVVRFLAEDRKETEPTPTETVNNPVSVKPGTWNIRSYPSTDAPIVATVKGGTVIEHVISDEWIPVKFGNLSGWISKKALGV